MYNYPLKVRIHNPEVEKEVKIPLYSSLEEAEQNLGRVRILEIVNDSLIITARLNIRNEMITDLQRKHKNEKDTNSTN